MSLKQLKTPITSPKSQSSPARFPTLVSTETELQAAISSISLAGALYIDLEGNELSRNGTIALITIYASGPAPGDKIWIIDVLTLGKGAFTTTSSSGASIKSILADSKVKKHFWDVRNDADALWSLYAVDIANPMDIQLLENASRPDDKQYLRGLDKCVERDLKLGFMDSNRWLKIKKDIKNLMPQKIFSVRPIQEKTLLYCANDVIHLPALQDVYLKRITPNWLELAKQQSIERVKFAQLPQYDPQSPSKRFGPWATASEQSSSSSSSQKKVISMEEMLDIWWEAQIEDDYDEPEYDDFDDEPWCTNSRDAAWDDTFDSCWERN